MDKSYITFESTTQEMRAKKILEENGISFKLIPAPRSISCECSFAFALTKEDTEEFIVLAEVYNLRNFKVH